MKIAGVKMVLSPTLFRGDNDKNTETKAEAQ